MALPRTIQPRAGIDDARPLLFWDESQRQQSAPTLDEDQPPRPLLTLAPGSFEQPPQSAPTGSVVERRTAGQRPHLNLGDILPQRTSVPRQPEYQRRGKFSFWERVKAGLNGAKYNAGGGLEGMIGGFAGGIVKPDQIDEANFVTGPLAAWRRQVEAGRAEDDRNLSQTEKYLRLAKMVSDINASNKPSPLKPLTNAPNISFLDEDNNEVVIPNGPDGKPMPTSATLAGERNYDLSLERMERQHEHQLQMLDERLQNQIELLTARGIQTHQLESFKQSGRTAIQRMRERHAREMWALRQRR